MSKRFYSFQFTWNNYPSNYRQIVEDIAPVYAICGEEIAPTTGTPHIQGFIKFKSGHTIRSVSKKLGNSHVEKAICEEALIEYSEKDGQFWEYGNRPTGSGKRTDLSTISDAINAGNGMRDLFREGTLQNYQQIKVAEYMLKYMEQPRNWLCDVKWFYGPTGTGKTKKAFEIMPNAYVCMSTAKWFEGYDGHSDVIIDDMRKDFCKFHELLRILDSKPLRVETKGGSRQFRAKRIIITSCYHPSEMFETREDVEQLIRRIGSIQKIENKEISMKNTLVF